MWCSTGGGPASASNGEQDRTTLSCFLVTNIAAWGLDIIGVYNTTACVPASIMALAAFAATTSGGLR